MATKKEKINTPSVEQMKVLKLSMDKIDKDFGKGTVMFLDEKPVFAGDNTISTGSLGLDFALGIGGLPKGRVIEIYGPESCIAGNSFLHFSIYDEKNNLINSKGGSLSRLYERFHNKHLENTPKQGRHLQKHNNLKFYIKSANHENCIIRNEVLDVVKTGKKQCFHIVTEDGQELFSTKDHKFMTSDGFVELSNLKIGDKVFIHNNTRTKGREKYENRKEILVKYHPKLPIKIIDNKYLYYRGQVSRLVYEAFLNNVSYEEYIHNLNTLEKSTIDTFHFLPDNIHVHHEDENFKNNDISNLRLISPSEHGKLHAKDRIKNLSFIAVLSTIKSIVPVGEMETFDLKCAYPYNNYVANGFVVHNCGKTTLAMHVIAEAQKKGGVCAIIDAEHAFDSGYARSLGIDTKTLLISQPDYGEQGLEVLDRLIDTGGMSVILVDSVSALVPKSELEGEMGDSKMGLHARLMSQALRKITGKVAKTNTIVIFINQLREKIGVMFGCLHADMPIVFTDGRTFPIKQVVEEKIKGNVWCVNEKTGKVESQPIMNWHCNGDVSKNEDFIHIETNSINGKGRFGITVTPNHEILTNFGWVTAEKLNIGDGLISKYESCFGEDGEDFIKGCLVGDSTTVIRYKNTGSLKFQDSKNSEYVKWKVDCLNCANFKQNGKRWESEYTYEFAKLKKDIQNRNPLQIFKNGKISDLSLAIWIMDDGHFKKTHNTYSLSVKRFKNNKIVLDGIKTLFSKSLINCKYNLKSGEFRFDSLNSKIIVNKIRRFVPDCMSYKLPPNVLEETVRKIPNISKLIKTDNVFVLSKRIGSNRQLRQKGKYDISIKRNHNYFSGGYKNGVVVHNSPETTTGGNALKFYASVRLDVRRNAQIKDGEEVVANLVKVKVVKNKVAPPFKAANLQLRFGIGFDKYAEIVEASVALGVIDKAGSWYSYKGDKLGQGAETVRKLFADNEELFKEIYNHCHTKLFNQ